MQTNLPAQDLVDGGAFFERALRHHLGPHLLHVQHEGVQRLLDVRLFLCNTTNSTTINTSHQPPPRADLPAARGTTTTTITTNTHTHTSLGLLQDFCLSQHLACLFPKHSCHWRGWKLAKGDY